MINQDFPWSVPLEKEKPARLRVWSLRIIFMTSVVLVVQLAFHFFVAPQIRITRVVIEGAGGISNEEILKLAGLSLKEYYFSVDQNAVQSKLEASGYFKKAGVQKLFPETLRIDLSRRMPVAVVMVTRDGGNLILALDSEGVVCDFLKRDSELNFPVISGVEFQDVKIGLKLPEALGLLMADLGSLKSRAGTLYQWISEIEVHKSRNSTFTMTVYPSVSPLKIQMADRLEERLLKEAAVVADMLKRRGMENQVQILDFRTDQIVLSAAEG